MQRSRRILSSGLLLAALVAGMVLAAACPRMAEWRDQQISTSHRLAQGDRIVPPPTPIAVPRKVSRALPLDPSFTVLEFVPASGAAEMQLTALSAWNVEQTVIWMLGALGRLGYTTEDNPSRILEGVEYSGPDDGYAVLWLKVTSNNAGQCIVSFEAAEQ